MSTFGHGMMLTPADMDEHNTYKGKWLANIDGGYPLLFLTAGSDVLCSTCAQADREAVDCAVPFYEGPAEYCNECGHTIESAYGDPGDPAKAD
jgi:hypothetical protein